MRLSLEIDFPNIIVQSLSVGVTHFRNNCLTEPRLCVFVKFVGKLNPTLPSSAGQANALCVIIGGRAPLLFLELQMMIILHFRRFVGSDQRPARQPSPFLLVMAEPAWNDDAYNPIIVCGPTAPAALPAPPRSEQCRVRRHSHSPHSSPHAGPAAPTIGARSTFRYNVGGLIGIIEGDRVERECERRRCHETRIEARDSRGEKKKKATDDRPLCMHKRCESEPPKMPICTHLLWARAPTAYGSTYEWKRWRTSPSPVMPVKTIISV